MQVIKSVSMKDGPRPRQLALVAAIWLFSLLLGLERMLVLQMQDRATTSRSAWQSYTILTSISNICIVESTGCGRGSTPCRRSP